MSQPLLSVVIPTCNRYQYLKDCIKATLNVGADNLEIIIHDNTQDNAEILSFLQEIHDRRLKYYHVIEHLSLSDNCELAVEKALGKYICMIGDDDTICASMIKATSFCEKNSIDACMSIIPGFNWPDMTFKGNREPNLFYEEKADGTITTIDSKEVLFQAITSAGGLPGKMPRVYHGVVSRECLNSIKEMAGSFFPGPSPDMANSVAVALSSKKSVFVSDYLMVSGYSYHSARGEGNRKQHYGKLNEKKWLPNDIEKQWLNDIPRIFSGETIYAQSLVQALKKMGRNDLAEKYNYGALYAMFLAHHRDTLGYMIGFCLKKPVRFIWFAKGILRRNKERKEYFRNMKAERYFQQFEDISNLMDAQKYTEELRSGIGDYHYASE